MLFDVEDAFVNILARSVVEASTHTTIGAERVSAVTDANDQAPDAVVVVEYTFGGEVAPTAILIAIPAVAIAVDPSSEYSVPEMVSACAENAGRKKQQAVSATNTKRMFRVRGAFSVVTVCVDMFFWFGSMYGSDLESRLARLFDFLYKITQFWEW